MHRILALVSLALAVTTLPASAQMITITPAQIGEVFCISRLGNDIGPTVGLLTPALTQAIAEAEEKNTAWETANPGEKPPLGDGIPWQSYPDYAAQCAAGNVEPVMEGAWVAVEINYVFPDALDANYTDRLHLRQVTDPSVSAPFWRIDNVEYSDGGDLRSTLVSAFAN